jgi:hypothetical protein
VTASPKLACLSISPADHRQRPRKGPGEKLTIRKGEDDHTARGSEAFAVRPSAVQPPGTSATRGLRSRGRLACPDMSPKPVYERLLALIKRD